MIGTTHHQSLLFFLPLSQQVSLLKDDLLDPVEQMLEDSELLELVRNCVAGADPLPLAPVARGLRPIACCVAVC